MDIDAILEVISQIIQRQISVIQSRPHNAPQNAPTTSNIEDSKLRVQCFVFASL